MDVVYSSADMAVVDNFLPTPDKLLSAAQRASYGPYRGQDGVTYERVSEHLSKDVVDALNEYMGRPISLLGMGFFVARTRTSRQSKNNREMRVEEAHAVPASQQPGQFSGDGRAHPALLERE